MLRFKRLWFVVIAAICSLFLVSCARDAQREARYNEKECPFCTTKPATCTYCHETGKCSFCQGAGKRVTVSAPIPEKNMKEVSYTEDCPFCKGTKVCRYCDGKGKCYACHGTAKIESWDFFEQFGKKK